MALPDQRRERRKSTDDDRLLVRGSTDAFPGLNQGCAGPPSVADVEAPEATMTRAISEGLVSLDTVDMGHLFAARAVVMKRPPKFLFGAYRAAMRIA